jgi:putative FmdB family regulatory protein
MPLYEYHCMPCDFSFEALVKSTGETVHCPRCDTVEVDKQLSVPAAAQTAGGRSRELPQSLGAGSPAAFGCGRPQCGSGTCAGLG